MTQSIKSILSGGWSYAIPCFVGMRFKSSFEHRGPQQRFPPKHIEYTF